MKAGTRIYILVLIAGLLMTISSAADAITLFKEEPAALASKEFDDFTEGEMVEGEVAYVFDIVATLETKRTIYGIPYSKSETPYYLAIVTDSEDYIKYYTVLHVTNSDNIEKIDEIMDGTQNYIVYGDESGLGSSINVQTKTEEMPDELQEYVYEYFSEFGYTQAECDDLVTDCVLEELNYKSAKVMPLIGIAVIVLSTAIFIIVKIIRKPKQVYVNEIPTAASVNMQQGGDEYPSGAPNPDDFFNNN